MPLHTHWGEPAPLPAAPLSRASPENRLFELKGISFWDSKCFGEPGLQNRDVPAPSPGGELCWEMDIDHLSSVPEWVVGRGRELLGDTRASPSVSCRCPLVETGKISEKICWCWTGCGGWKPTRGSRVGCWVPPLHPHRALPSTLLPECLFYCCY